MVCRTKNLLEISLNIKLFECIQRDVLYGMSKLFYYGDLLGRMMN